MMSREIRATGRRVYPMCVLFIAAIVSGCVSSYADTSIAGPTLVGTTSDLPLSAEQLAFLERRSQREQELLAEALTAESAAELALLHHPAVERALETLGMPGFDRLLLAHTVNPAFNRGRPPSTVDTRIEKSISVNLMTWVSVAALDPGATSAERTPLVQAADEIVDLLFVARRAWVYATFARQSLIYLEDVAVAAEAGREIVESMRKVGNSTELELLRAQTLYADAVAQLTAGQVAAAVERERLVQALGLWGAEADSVQLPERLPDVHATAVGPEGLEARAVSQRFDVRAGRLEGLAGEAGVNARADVRTAWLAYRGAFDLAGHARDAVVPLAQRVSEEQLKLYNGMLIGVLDLVSDATERSNVVNAALESVRDFWLAEIELQRAMSGVGIPAGTLPGAPNTFRPGATYHVH
jgi:hypothetical protein